MIKQVSSFVRNNRKVVTTAVVSTAAVVSSSANAALVQADVDAIVTGITADAAIAIAAGFGILAVVLGARVGFGLVKSFISAGAN